MKKRTSITEFNRFEKPTRGFFDGTVRITVRDKRGRFASPVKRADSKKELSVWIKDKDSKKSQLIVRNQPGLTKAKLNVMKVRYSMPNIKPGELIIDTVLKGSIETTLRPYKRLLAQYDLVDIIIDSGRVKQQGSKDRKDRFDEPIKILKVPLHNENNSKIRGRYTGKLSTETHVQRIRREIKINLAVKNYAVTPKNIRMKYAKGMSKNLTTIEARLLVYGYKYER